MREIKFRGKNDDGKWFYGYVKDAFHYPDYMQIILINKDGGFCGFASVLIETVGQYIGLKDKNGVEIYEGDILDVGGAKMYIRYVPCTFYGDSLVGEFYKVGEYSMGEVIGNIHENPGLLEKR